MSKSLSAHVWEAEIKGAPVYRGKTRMRHGDCSTFAVVATPSGCTVIAYANGAVVKLECCWEFRYFADTFRLRALCTPESLRRAAVVFATRVLEMAKKKSGGGT